jgi:hypothetical protein
MSSTPLAELQRRHLEFGPEAAGTKLALLKRLARTRLGSARTVRRLHEMLCFMRAYPDDPALLAQVQAMLAGFAGRADVRAHRTALADSGIAGTAIHYRFFAGQAQWLAKRWPSQLRLDRDDSETQARIARALPPLLTLAEAQALNELKLPGYAALDRLRANAETDAVFLLRRIAAMPGNGFTREAYSDAVDASTKLASRRRNTCVPICVPNWHAHRVRCAGCRWPTARPFSTWRAPRWSPVRVRSRRSRSAMRATPGSSTTATAWPLHSSA